MREGPMTATLPARTPRPVPPGRRSDSLELGAYPEAVALARTRTRALLTEWGLDELADDAAMVMSELVTNSVTATRAAGLDTPVRVTLLAGLRTLLIAVWDASPEAPVPADAGDDDEDGRGLLIVETLTARWDWKKVPGERGGKVVRALVRPDRSSS
jgi:anti-sigma regulatory factor (Ser/Thr protein kinase)